MSLTGRWIDLIFRIATGDWKTRLVVAPIAGALFLSLIAFFILLSLVADDLFNLPYLFRGPWSMITGICLILSGAFLMFISIIYFVKVRGTPVPFSPPPKLITTGPYRIVRNPMLTGLFMLLFGTGIIMDSISLVFFFTPLFIAANIWELRKVEEPELVKRLGQEYVEYRKRTPMFFPFRTKRQWNK
jgi:protein-S-isoprenylcysteine O-methyltransferase Ste14